MKRFSPRSNGSESHIGLPSPGVLQWEKEPSECLALKTSVAYFWETQRAMGNRDSTLKGCTQNCTRSGTQGRSSNLKGVWVRPPADLGESPGKVGGNGAHPGQIETGGSYSEEFVLPCGHWCWQESVWKPSSSLLALGPGTTHQPVGTSAGPPHTK